MAAAACWKDGVTVTLQWPMCTHASAQKKKVEKEVARSVISNAMGKMRVNVEQNSA
jgi:hypothetical protein